MSPHHPTAVDPAGPEPADAIALLQADHEAVGRLFAAYGADESVARKRALVAQICSVLRVRTQIEEEIFYPEVMMALRDKLLVPQARAEHGGVRALMAQLQGAELDGATYDAKVQVLSDHVRHHARDAHAAMFPQAKATSLDMMDIGARMAARRDDLLARAA